MYSPTFLGWILASCLFSVVAATQFPNNVPDNTHPNVDISPLSSSGWIRDPRGGHEHDRGNQNSKQAPLPDPVMVSTSQIRVGTTNGEAHRNDGSNPHPAGKVKRQILFQDAAQYLGGQAMLSPAAVHPQQEYIVHRDPVTGAFFGGTPAPLQFQSVTASPVPNQLLVLSQNPNTRSSSTTGNNKKPSKFLSRQGETDHQDSSQQQEDHSNSNDEQGQYDHSQQIFQAFQQTQHQQQHQHQYHQQQQQAAEYHEQPHHQQASENHQTILLSPSPSTILHAQTQPNPQFIQIQQQQQQPQLPPVQRIYQGQNGQTYIVHQPPQQPAFNSAPAEGHSAQIGNFRPQTYVAGPGGQLFTVPVPVQQADSRQHSGEESSGSVEDVRSKEKKRRRNKSSGEGSDEEEERQPDRPISSFMRRIMEAFTVRGDASERLGTNIALPVLASTGVFFGLGALAAGWYLSNANREVGILRRTGRPVPPGTHNVQRIRRSAPGPPPEVDQSTFFQSIIQQAIEKQKDQFETGDEPQSETVMVDDPESSNSKYGRRRPTTNGRHDLVDLEEFQPHTSPNSKVAHRPIHSKGGWGPSRQTWNFAKVAIPAVILFGAVIAIGVVIFGWYITGSNREIAFMEPSAYSRRKRDLTTTALGGTGGLGRVLSAIHTNPYDDSRSQSYRSLIGGSSREVISRLSKTSRKRRSTGTGSTSQT